MLIFSCCKELFQGVARDAVFDQMPFALYIRSSTPSLPYRDPLP